MNCSKHSTYNALQVIGALLITALISGCSSSRISLSDKGLVSVKTQDSENVKILWTDIYEQEGKTWAYGALQQHQISPGVIKTHVDIQVLNAEGFVHYETQTNDLFVSRNRVGKGREWKRFRAPLPELAEDSRICITVHSGSHETEDEKS